MMVDPLEVILVGLILSADSFSAALAMGVRPHKVSDSFRFAFISSLSEVFVAGIGAFAGAKIIARFDQIDHWFSFALLTAVAIHMLYEGFESIKEKEGKGPNSSKKFHSFYKILAVSLATSIDALAVGMSLGASSHYVQPYLASIGICVFLATILGMEISKRAASWLGPVFHFIAAFILLALAIKFMI